MTYNMQNRKDIDAKLKMPTRAQMMVSNHWDTTKRYDSGMRARYAKIETMERY